MRLNKQVGIRFATFLRIFCKMRAGDVANKQFSPVCKEALILIETDAEQTDPAPGNASDEKECKL